MTHFGGFLLFGVVECGDWLGLQSEKQSSSLSASTSTELPLNKDGSVEEANGQSGFDFVFQDVRPVEPKKAKPLTMKQERFAVEFVQCGNASEAYRRAYDATNSKANSIHVAACKVQSNKMIQARIAELREAIQEKMHATKLIPVSDRVGNALADLFPDSEEREQFCSDVISSAMAKIAGGLRAMQSRRSIGSGIRYHVLHRAGFKCQACGAKPSDSNDVELAIDHIVPLSLGGSNDASNLQVLCAPCNGSKSNKFSFNHLIGAESDLA